LRLILESTQEGVLHGAITIHLFDAVNSKYYNIINTRLLSTNLLTKI
jgi:hypothetical protein